jgi:S1-C subfamily serine protease
VAALSRALVAAVEAAAPSLLRVEGRPGRAASGTAVSATRLVTAHHALHREEHLRVAVEGGGELEAELVGADPSTDLALLEVRGGGLTAAPWAEDLSGVRVGQVVLALGRPGRGARATWGIVSALGPEWRSGMGGRVDAYLETDADRPPGFSGGALVAPGGAVLGMLSAALGGRWAHAVLPSATVRRVVQALEAHGQVRRGYLGVGAQPVALPPHVRGGAEGAQRGLLVVSLEQDGPAARGGVLLGDVLLSLDGEPLGDMGALFDFLAGERVGRQVQAEVLRAGALQRLALTVGQRPRGGGR